MGKKALPSERNTHSTHATPPPPPYQPAASSNYNDEKQGQVNVTDRARASAHFDDTQNSSTEPCTVHGTSQTPHFDHELRQPKSKATLQALIAALNDVVEEGRCTECAMESSAHILTGYFMDMRTAKKNGQWSKEDARALKVEVKSLAKRVKREVKATYKAKA